MELQESPSTRSVLGACPLDCPDACAWIVDLENGKPTRLRASKEHPFTRGTLCTKTNPYLDYRVHPDRLLWPQKRIGPKGSGRFTRITWDEALETIAGRLRSVRDQYGAEAIWPYAGSGTVGWIQGIVGSGKRLFHALGASQHDPNICSVAGHEGMRFTTQSAAGMDPEDLAHSRLILLWGTNILVTNRHLWPFIRQAQKNGAKVVTIDPLFTDTAKRSDLHVPIRPGTDGALALGLMQALVERNAVDTSYLEKHSLGWEGFRTKVLPAWTFSRTLQTCGISEETLTQLVDWLSRHSPMAIRSSMGMQRHFGGGQAARVVSCLPAVTGDYQRRGGGLCYSTGPAYKLNFEALTRPDLQPHSTRSLAMTRLGQGLLDLKDPPVQALFMWAANPVVSNPDQGRVRQGLQREDLFTVVIENFQTDTADYADILLPGTMQIEHADLHDSYSHLYLQWNEPAVAPPGECLSHTEIFRRLAKHLELSDPALYASDEEMARDALSSNHPFVREITLEKLKERGWARLQVPKPFLPFAEGFPTPSGKFEFYSERALQEGFGAYPSFTPPHEAVASKEASKTDSLVLLAPATRFLMNSVYGNHIRKKSDAKPIAFLHPAEATRRALRDGMQVRLENQRGFFEAELQVDSKVPRGIVVSPKGFWPKLVGGNSVNATVAERDADMGRGAVFSDNRVWVSQANSRPSQTAEAKFAV